MDLQREHLSEFLSFEHTRAFIDKVIPQPGDPLITNQRRPIAELVADTSPGVHDTLIAACDLFRYKNFGVTEYHDNCADNMRLALKAIGLRAREVPQPFNLWMNIPIKPDYSIEWLPPVSKAGDYVDIKSGDGIASWCCPRVRRTSCRSTRSILSRSSSRCSHNAVSAIRGSGRALRDSSQKSHTDRNRGAAGAPRASARRAAQACTDGAQADAEGRSPWRSVVPRACCRSSKGGHATPSLATLHKIALALSTNVGTLVAGPEVNTSPVQRADERPTTGFPSAGRRASIMLERVIVPAPGQLLQSDIHVIEPRANSDEQISHAGEELGYVIEGELELTLGDRRYLLRTGDTFYFPSTVPHSYRNPGKIATRVLWVNTPPTF